MEEFYKLENQNDFFDILPLDWKEEISGIWNEYYKKAEIWVIKYKDDIITGGIVFSTCPPDMKYNIKEAEKWIHDGFLYIGFLYVSEQFRSFGYGSKWLTYLFSKFPNHKFWLTIEDENLQYFYMKNRFKMIKTLQNGQNKEWLLIYEPKSDR